MNIGEKFYCSRCMREMEDEGTCSHCGYDPGQPASRSALEEGTLLHSGRYQLGAVIGVGGSVLHTLPGTIPCPRRLPLKNISPKIFAKGISMRAMR